MEIIKDYLNIKMQKILIKLIIFYKWYISWFFNQIFSWTINKDFINNEAYKLLKSLGFFNIMSTKRNHKRMKKIIYKKGKINKNILLI